MHEKQSICILSSAIRPEVDQAAVIQVNVEVRADNRLNAALAQLFDYQWKLGRGEAVRALPQVAIAVHELTSRETRNIVVWQIETREAVTFNHHALIRQTKAEAVESGFSALGR